MGVLEDLELARHVLARYGPKVIFVRPESCEPPHRISHPEKVVEFADQFRKYGWARFPVLVGYEWHGRLQLLSGTHRLEAARLTGIEVPVVVHSYENVLSAWGNLEEWRILMNEQWF